MAWIESHQELWRHPKTRKLSRLLEISIPTAVGHLHGLWYWALDFAQDGDLSRYLPEDIADAALWDGDAKQFLTALLSAGFINESPLELHDWDDYAGRLLEKRELQKEQNKERQQKFRDRKKAVTSPSHNSNALRNGGVTESNNTTVPNHTYQTQPDSTIYPPPPTGDKQQTVPYDKIMTLFNSICRSLPKIQRIDGQRQKAVAARWHTYGAIDSFESLFKKAESSSFLKGENDRNWRADFDWLIKAGNFTKVLEGRYDGQRGDQNGINTNQQRAGSNRDKPFVLAGFKPADEI